MRDEIVDVDLAVHVPIDDLWYIGAAARAAECGPLPHAPRDQLEWTGRNLLAGARDADNHRDSPAAVAALQRLAHQIHIADAFETIIGAAVSECDQVGHEIAADFLRIDEVRHAEFLGKRLAARIQIDADDFVGADHACALNDIEADAAETEYDHIRAGLHLGRVDHRANSRRHSATDVAYLVERGILADFRHGNLGQYRKIRERGAAHVVVHEVLADRKAAGAIRHESLALGCADRGAKIGLARGAGLALPALGRVKRNDMIAFAHGCHAGSDIDHDAGALVTENGRK